ncbi:unnamed protein product [Cylindrotheca closterium]|uniref:Sulfite exporter TauE/SafE n=1 Tax=Cylindrotheca closterium TaxID=2856 RepID=A0AAD2FU73_9STRA|nr:unnamed protein product [Cylindrotheca closterium]
MINYNNNNNNNNNALERIMIDRRFVFLLYSAVAGFICYQAMMMEEHPRDHTTSDDITDEYPAIHRYLTINGNSNSSSLEGVNKMEEKFEGFIGKTPKDLMYEENHNPLFPLDTRDTIGFSCAILGLMIAAGGGIGGGGILVPIYILVMEFSPKHAIPLSNITIFGGAIANMMLNARKKHPLADRPLVNWELILVMEPLTIAGALIGAFLNNLIPEVMLAIMLVALLSFTAFKTLKKATNMYQKESLAEMNATQAVAAAANNNNTEETPIKTSIAGATNYDSVSNEEEGKPLIQNGNSKELEAILEAEKSPPIHSILVLLFMFVVVLVINVLKGGGAFPSPLEIECGSKEFWLANVFMLGWILAVTAYVRSILAKQYQTKQRIGYQYVEGDIQWDDHALAYYPSICSLAGFFAGMFGVGGGIVKGPLMLAMGVHPSVASASSACMILFTSSTATTSFFVFGLLDRTYAPVCFTIGFVSTFFGQVLLGILMKRTKRNSYIAYSIGLVVLLSAIMMTIQSLIAIHKGEHHKTGGICGSDQDF